MVEERPLRERVARAIWDKRPDCISRAWPLETAEQRRAYTHDRQVAAADLCLIYADAAIRVIQEYQEEGE